MKEVMKTSKLVTVLTLASLLGVGCSKSSSSNSAGTLPVINGVIPGAVIIDQNTPTNTGGGTTSTTTSYGSTVAFQPVSMQTMNEYVATHPLNAPTNFKINLNLVQSGSGRYGGTVSIGYTDNGIQYNGEFKAGLGSNQSFKGMYDNGELEAKYNYWFKLDNKLVFTAFFEDQYGAVTITLVPQTTTTTGGNDAEPNLSGPYKGYVYFKNFTTTFAQHSPYRSCWFVYDGPYDCRSNVIQTKCGLYPGAEAGYKLLGTFNNININQAFNIQ